MGFFSRVRRGAAVLALPLVLVACGDDSPTPAPSVSDPVTVSPSPTATGPVAPEISTQAGQRTEAGFKAFVEFYVATIGYAHIAGDTSELKELSTKGCRGCQGGLAYLDRIAADGGHVEFTSGQPSVKIKKVLFNESAADSLTQATGTLTMPAGREVYPPGGPASKDVTPTSGEYVFTGVWTATANGWRIAAVTPR